MSDRTINWGDSEVEAVYQTGDDDPDGGGNFIVARDTDGGVTLLEYDPVAGEWVARGDVNLDGNDLSANVIDAAEVSADDYNDGAIDHDGTSNRTHSGDDLSPNAIDAAAVSATAELSGATASEGDVVTLPEDPDVVPIFFDAQTGQPLVPDLEETV